MRASPESRAPRDNRDESRVIVAPVLNSIFQHRESITLRRRAAGARLDRPLGATLATLDPPAVAVGDLLDEVVALVRPLASGRQITIDYMPSNGGPQDAQRVAVWDGLSEQWTQVSAYVTATKAGRSEGCPAMEQARSCRSS